MAQSRSQRQPEPRSRRRQGLPTPVALVVLGALGGLLLALMLAGGASANHGQATCPNQTWGETLLVGLNNTFSDDCIRLVGNLTVAPFSMARFHDVMIEVDAEAGNLTITVSPGAIFEMTDLDGDPSTTNDRSSLTVLNRSNTTAGFNFIAIRSSVYINDTDIFGVGLGGFNLTNLAGLYIDSPTDFGFNRVDHTTFSAGLMLVNYTNASAIRYYNVTGGLFSVFLSEVGNISFTDLNVRSPSTTGVLINNSYNVSFLRWTSQAAQSAIVANRVVGLNITTLSSSTHRVGLDLTDSSEVNMRGLTITGPLGSSFGIQIRNGLNITLRNATLSSHGQADLHITALTRNVFVDRVTLQLNRPPGHGLWIEESGTSLNPNNFWFTNMTINAKAGTGAIVSDASGVVFDNVTISVIQGPCLDVEQSDSIRFSNGTIRQCGGVGAHLDGTSLTLENSSVTVAAGGGVEVGKGSYTIERVFLDLNGFSIRSFDGTNRAVELLGPGLIANSTIPGSASDGINLLLSKKPLSTSRLTIFNNTLSGPNATAAPNYAIYLDGFATIDVCQNTIWNLAVVYLRTDNVRSCQNTYNLNVLRAGASPFMIDFGTTANVSGERFTLGSPAPMIGTVLRIQNVSVSVELSNMRLPLGDVGILVTALPSSFPSVVSLTNVTVFSRTDAIVISGFRDTIIASLRVELSRTALVVSGASDKGNILIRDVRLQANRTGLRLTSDTFGIGLVAVSNVSFNRSGALPLEAVNVTNGGRISLSEIDVAGLFVGIYVTDARSIFLTRMNFTNNSFGFWQSASASLSSIFNWTIDTPTALVNTTFRFNGEITVSGAFLNISNRTRVFVFATVPTQNPSRIIVLDNSTLRIAENASIVAEPANSTTGQVRARFTIELAPTVDFYLAHATIDGLGNLTSTDPLQQGIVLARRDTIIEAVVFLNATRPLSASGINLTVLSSLFSSSSTVNPRYSKIAISISDGRLLLLVNSSVSDLGDGVSARNSVVRVDRASFSQMGAVLSLDSSSGNMTDSGVDRSSFIVVADHSSTADVCRVTGTSISTAFKAVNGSTVNVCASWLGNVATDAETVGGGFVTFENTFVNRTKPNTDPRVHDYSAKTSAVGTVDVFWELRVAACLLSSGGLAEGASVLVLDGSGNTVILGATDASGVTPLFGYLEFESRNGQETYFSPLSITVSFGSATNTSVVAVQDASVIVVCLDDVPPRINVQSPTNNSTLNARVVSVRATAVDPESGLVANSPCASVNGAPPVCGSRSLPLEFTANLLEGLNLIVFTATDKFGNTASVTIYVTADTTGPSVTWCTPDTGFKTREPVVEVTCQFTGEAVFAQFGSYAMPIDANQQGHATITLISEGAAAFELNTKDSFGIFLLPAPVYIFVLDRTAPQIKLFSKYNGTHSNDILFLTGEVDPDTALFEFNGVNKTPTGGVDFSFQWLPLLEGLNTATLHAVDDVGNERTLDIWILIDTMTNCSLVAPVENQVVARSPFPFGGVCDLDVTLTISGVDQPVRPGPDGRWTAGVPLVQGKNTIEISGTDSHGTTWFASIALYYEPSPPSAPPFLLILAIIALGTFIAAFVIQRNAKRPREPVAPPPRPTVGSQKAPPTPRKPPTIPLPEYEPPRVPPRPQPPRQPPQQQQPPRQPPQQPPARPPPRP